MLYSLQVTGFTVVASKDMTKVHCQVTRVGLLVLLDTEVLLPKYRHSTASLHPSTLVASRCIRHVALLGDSAWPPISGAACASVACHAGRDIERGCDVRAPRDRAVQITRDYFVWDAAHLRSAKSQSSQTCRKSHWVRRWQGALVGSA